MRKIYSEPRKVLLPAFLFLQTIVFTSLLIPHISFAQAGCTAPVLVVNTPAPVCSPATINLRSLVDDAASSLPTGTILNYYYDNGSLTTVSDPSAVSQSGNYRITATSPDGCGDAKQVTVTVNQSPTVNPFNGSFCSNETSLIALSGQYISLWSGPGVVLSSNSYYFKPSSAGAGTHTLVATNGNGGCQASMQVVVKQAPILVLTTLTPPAVCSPATVNLTSLINYSASTLPQGTIITYQPNASSQVPDPTAVSASGSYYIGAFLPSI